jgi:hypothetical protein
MIMFSIFGYSGQYMHHFIDKARYERLTQPVEQEQRQGNLLKRMARSKWSPLRELTDDEYEGILKDQLLKLETEVALIDERIVELKNTANGKK